MAYAINVDHKERKLHFATHHHRGMYAVDSDQAKTSQIINGESGKKVPITKATMMKRFLKENGEFFTATEVSEMLKVNVRTLRRSIIGDKKYPGQHKLNTYDVNYYYTRELTQDMTHWSEIPASNLTTLIHYKDLHSFLCNVIELSYTYVKGHSVLYDLEEDFIEDAFGRTKETTKWIANKDIYVLLRHQHTKSEIAVVAKKIIKGEYELHSLATLKDIVDRSSSTYDRLAKSLDSVKIKFNEDNKKPTARYVFARTAEKEEEQKEAISNELTELITTISNNKVVIIPQAVPADYQFQELSFEEPIDYLSVFIQGYEGLPKGYYRASDGLLYFAVEASDTELEGISINSIVTPKRWMTKDIIKQFLLDLQY
ncbi:hypothetical protein P4679_33225 [Priestia megaterium]|uniref:hypothetical protein n=1 Tax=Priestia megaterium TaxID=1404 RepID=UPI002E1FA6D1|nr:hypothetical protein [Priestia megaterium]